MLIGISDPLGAKTDRLRCEVCQNLNLSPINTGPLRYAVATALTVYGIETRIVLAELVLQRTLQQLLPFTVLKLNSIDNAIALCNVATALTVYGIETFKSVIFSKVTDGACCNSSYRLRY